MSAPRILAQIVILGGRIVGTAFIEAWRQAGRNMRAGGSALGSGSAPGAGISANDQVSRQYRMTVDEARNILNIGKKTEQSELMTQLLENYESMMKANEKTSHYVQSKIVRARERLEAEFPELSKSAAEQANSNPPSSQAPPA